MLALGEAGLSMEGVELSEIADAVGTPTWVIGAGTIRARYRRLEAALAARGIGPGAIHYAVKANDHLAVLSVLARLGAGADAVSVGEIERALAAGVPAGRIVFSGVGKVGAELERAVRVGVGQVNVESVEELRELAAVARRIGRVQAVALRVNPDVAAGTHDKISTGRAGDKFGIPFETVAAAYADAKALDGVRAVGLAAHIGSQIMTGAPFATAAGRLAVLVDGLRAAGHAVEAVDAGGGLGISYGDGADGDPEAFAGAIAERLGGRGLLLTVEPGRWLVGPAGVLLASVVRVKAGWPVFLILDAAMNDLARPSLYGAWHGVVPVGPARAGAEVYDIVGPVCETSDVLGRGRVLPACLAGDRVAILDAGAYGAVMSSTYNARPLAAQVMVDDGRWSVIRPRQALDALWRDEGVPAWLGS
jgi:diaminopimelate decarboxylase